MSDEGHPDSQRQLVIDDEDEISFQRNEMQIKAALGALGIADDDDSRDDVPLEDIVRALKAKDPDSSLAVEHQDNV